MIRTKDIIKLAGAVVIIAISVLLFIYPAVIIGAVMVDRELRTTGQSRFVPGWFESAAGRYNSWAQEYLDSEYAGTLYHDDVAATEWPMFGSVFFLVMAEDLQKQGKVDAESGPLREAVEKAAQIVVSPVTATWVITKWGDNYLEEQNVFYRMLLILGLSSYENITGDSKYHTLMSEQRKSLAAELERANMHLGEDYPGECYPNDVLWAVAAIQRAALLDHTNHVVLAEELMAIFDGPINDVKGLPAFQVRASSGKILQNSRGCGNSGILPLAAELDPVIATKWYCAHEKNFWKDTGWVVGFTEEPHGASQDYMDVDSGPVIFGFGSVASAFGIGAAKAVGRIDHAAPLTMEAVACSWPTPFGYLLPGLMGKMGADSWCLGEIALLFSMTRPTYVPEVIPFNGSAPGIVWILLVAYVVIGVFFISVEVHYCIKLLRGRLRGK